MENVFIKYIIAGKIRNLEELKKAFRKVAKKTHPDSAGSDKYVKDFIQFKNYFNEAKQFLNSNNIIPQENKSANNENFRYLFFQEMQKLYILESRFFWEKNEIDERIKSVNDAALDFFKKWKNDYHELYMSACREYDKIKKEKPKYILANLRKPSIYQNLRPVFFNIFKFHITGLNFYQKQLRNMEPVISRLEENSYFALKDYLLFLINDMKNGPAIFG